MYKIPAKTLFMGHSLVFMPECHSTNDETSHLIQTTPILDGTVVITDNQTAGRGQRGNTWIAEAGKNLTFSIFCKTSFLLAKDQFLLNMTFSLGLYDYLLEKLESNVRVKWPNDVLVNGKKICGMLIENHLKGQYIQQSIVGIGLNINQKKFPLSTATSISLESGKEYSLNEELESLLIFLESRFIQLRSQQYKKLKDDYLATLYRRGEVHEFKSEEEIFTGTISGVDETGRLAVETKSGTRFFGIKEIEFVK